MRRRSNGRGVPPKLRSTSFRAWALDNADPDIVPEMLSSARNLVVSGSNEIPEPAASPVGKIMRRCRKTPGTVLASTDASADSPTMQGSWTVQWWMRPRAVGTGSGDFVWMLSGDSGDVSDAANIQASVRITSAGTIESFWESGVGLNRTHDFTTYTLTLGRWIHCTLRKTEASGFATPLELIINGELIESASGIISADGGSSSTVRWRIGGNLAAADVLEDPSDVDIAALHVYDAVLPIDQIKNDFRRGLLYGFPTHIDLKVEAEDANGDTIDLTNLEGLDWVDDVTVTDSIDNAVRTGTVKLTREHALMSGAILRTDTKLNLPDPDVVTVSDPLLGIQRDIEVFAARVPLGIRASGLDWQSMIKGKIDRIGWSGDDISIDVRDEGAALVDFYIEEEVVNSTILVDAPIEKQPSYGLLAGDPIQSVIQDILNDNDNTGGNDTVAGLTLRTGSYEPLTMGVPIDPAWDLLPFRQQREPVMTAIRNLAAQIAWECRYRWVHFDDPEDDGWFLELYEAERDRLDSDVMLFPREILSVSAADLDVKNIRNVVRVVYPSSETIDPPLPATATGFLPPRNGWASTDGAGNRLPAFIELEHVASVAEFGRRFMEVGEASSSQIDTIDEANRMALGMAKDLILPEFEKSLTAESIFEIELCDVVRFEPIRELYTGIQKLAVKSLTHTFGSETTSSIQLRGAPAVGFKRWLRKDSRPGMGRPPVADPRQALSDSETGPLLRVMRQVLDNTDYLTGGIYLQLRNGNFQSFGAGIENEPDGWQLIGGTWTGTTGADPNTIVGDSQSGGFSIELDPLDTGTFTSNYIPLPPTNFQAIGFEMVWKRDASGAVPRVTFRYFDENKVAIEPYGAGHSNRGLHPTELDPHWETTKEARDVALIVGLAGDEIRIEPGVADAIQYAVDDILDYIPTHITRLQEGFFLRRGVVRSVDAGGGTPTYTVEDIDSGNPGAADFGPDEGSVGWRPPHWQANVDVAINPTDTWRTSRQVGIEPPSPDARFVRVELEAINVSGFANIQFDSIGLFRVAREVRISKGGDPSARTQTEGAWRHIRYNSPHPAPRTGLTLSTTRAGFDYGDNFRNDGFPSPTVSRGPHFLVPEDGVLVGFASFSGTLNPPSTGPIRGRVRIVKNMDYNDTTPLYTSLGGGSVLAVGQWADDSRDFGLDVSDSFIATCNVSVPVCAGDRINAEVYVEDDDQATVDVVDNADVSFCNFKLTKAE